MLVPFNSTCAGPLSFHLCGSPLIPPVRVLHLRDGYDEVELVGQNDPCQQDNKHCVCSILKVRQLGLQQHENQQNICLQWYDSYQCERIRGKMWVHSPSSHQAWELSLNKKIKKSKSWVGADCLLVKNERQGWGWCWDFMKTFVWIACFQLYAGTFSLQILISSCPFKFWKKQFKKKKRKKKRSFCVSIDS